jgi:hypothetical protein
MLVDSTYLVGWPIDRSSSVIKKVSPKTYGSHCVFWQMIKQISLKITQPKYDACQSKYVVILYEQMSQIDYDIVQWHPTSDIILDMHHPDPWHAPVAASTVVNTPDDGRRKRP